MEYKYRIERDDYSNAGKVSSNIKQILKQLGIQIDILRRIAIASYEAEINMIIHSYGGEIRMEIKDQGLVVLNFNDVGPGIENMEKAMTPGYSTASQEARELGFGAGMGLVNIKKVSDEFHLETSSDGTKLSLSFHIL